MRTTKPVGRGKLHRSGRSADVGCPLVDGPLPRMGGFVVGPRSLPPIAGRGETPPWDCLPKRSRRQAGQA